MKEELRSSPAPARPSDHNTSRSLPCHGAGSVGNSAFALGLGMPCMAPTLADLSPAWERSVLPGDAQQRSRSGFRL